MKFLYTGAEHTNCQQIDPELSLGGKVSDTIIPNDLAQNIFSVASYLSIQQKKRETKLIALLNDDPSKTATLITLNFGVNGDESCSEDSNGSIANYQIAFVSPNEENCFEKLSNAAALPYYATFQPIVSGQPISLPDLAPGEYLGIWLMRTYNYDSPDLVNKDLNYWKKIAARIQRYEGNDLGGGDYHHSHPNHKYEFEKEPGITETLDIILDYTLE
jgi:hypothetical protein